jgi:hypothetical protein
MANNLKGLDSQQVIRSVYNETDNSLNVSVVTGGGGGGGVEVVISHTDDSIRIGDGGDLVTTTTVGPDVGLDVNLLNTTLPLPTDAATETTLSSLLTELQQKTEPTDNQNVVATDLDIRNLTFVNDKVDVSGSEVSLDAATLAALENISVTVTSIGEVEIKNDSGNPVPMSVASLPLPSGASTSALQTTGNASLASIDSKLTSPIAVSGPVTDVELRAAPVPVSAASLPLPTGAATSANQATEIASLSSIDSKLTTTNSSLASIDAGIPVSLGQTTMAASMPVVISSDQSAVPVSITGTISLPTGAATAAKQDTGNASLASIDSKLTSPLTVTGPLTDVQLRASAVPVSLTSTTITGSVAVTGPLTNTELRATPVPVSGTVTANAGTGTFTVDGSAVTQPVSAASLPLPTGASTSALQTAGNASLSSIDTKLTAPLSVTGPLTDTQLRATPVPVSGTVTANLGTIAGVATETTLSSLLTELQLKADLTETQPVSAASLPLPTGAATSTLQTTGNASLSSIDTKLPSGLTVTASRLQVELPPGGVGLTDAELRASPVPVSGTVTANAGTGTFAVSAASLPLPSGAATAALQTQPGVDIGDVTVNNAGGASAVNIQDGGNSITVDGTVAISGSVAVTGPLTDTELRASAVPVSLTSTTITGTVAATQSGTWNINNISGTVSLPTGAATAALQTQPGVDIGDVTVNNAAGAAAVNIQDGGNSITVDGTVTANAGTGTFAVSAASLPLPTGAATSTNQTTANSSLSSIDGKLNSLGQKTMANSVPVTLASDQVPLVAATSTVTSVSVTTSSTSLLASNANRKGASFYNDGGADIYLKLGTTASSSSFTVKMPANAFYELPVPLYTGAIEAIAVSGTRTVRITELS